MGQQVAFVQSAPVINDSSVAARPALPLRNGSVTAVPRYLSPPGFAFRTPDETGLDER
jgi:hypothetical protein